MYECIYNWCSLADLVLVNLPIWQHLFVTSKSILVVLSRSVADMCRVVKTQSSEVHASSWDWARWCSVFLFSSHTVNKCPFPGLFSPVFFTFLCFFDWRFHCLIWSSNIVLLNARSLWRVMCLIRLFQASVIVLLVVRSMLISQQYVSNKMSLNRNSCKIRLHTYQLMKRLWPEARRNLTLHFP